MDTLWQFACPILNHYQLELSVKPSTDVSQENAEDVTLMLDILETASMVWDYCALIPEEKASSLTVLTQNLLGPTPHPGEAEQFMKLLKSMEALWATLSKSPEVFHADQSPCQDTEISSASSPLATNGHSHYGP